MSEQILKHENAVQRYENNLAIAKERNSKNRVKKYERLIKEERAKIKTLGITNSVQINADLREKINKINQDISKLQEAKDIVDKEINQKTEKLDKALNPLKTKIETEKPESEPIPTVQPIILIDEPKTEAETEKIPCPECGKLVKGDRGLRAHLSQWCKGEVKISS